MCTLHCSAKCSLTLHRRHPIIVEQSQQSANSLDLLADGQTVCWEQRKKIEIKNRVLHFTKLAACAEGASLIYLPKKNILSSDAWPECSLAF